MLFLSKHLGDYSPQKSKSGKKRGNRWNHAAGWNSKQNAPVEGR